MKKTKCLLVFLTIMLIYLSVFFVYADYPIQWYQVVFNGFDMGLKDVNCLISFKSHLYAATVELPSEYGYLWRTENGFDWENMNIGSMSSAAIRTMGVFNGYLYAGIGKITGAELWRSIDGLNWELVIANGFDTSNINIYSMAEYKGHFYVGTWCNWGGQIWRSSDGLTWNKINTNGFGNSNNVAITALIEFEGYLYAGTDKWTDGCEVWRSNDGTTWTRVVANGFGNVEYNDAIFCLEAFNGALYTSTMTYVDGFEIWMSYDGLNWQSAATKGFGDPINTAARNTWCDLKFYENALYAFTSLSRNVNDGGQVWRSFDGFTWERISDYGFGNPYNEKLYCSEIFDGYLFIGTHNRTTGCEIWTNKPPVLDVAIDIKPGSDPNSINPRNKGRIPVAILTTEEFNAMDVDAAEVRFGRTGTEASPVHYAFEDVDYDGDLDLILHFKTQETGIQCGDTQAFLTGKTLEGQDIQGADSIRTVGCK